jgi:MshEN domain
MSILTRILLDKNLIDKRQLEIAVRSQVVFGGRLGTNLIEMEYLSEQQMTEVLSQVYHTECVDLATQEPDISLLSIIPFKYVGRYKVFPWRLRGRTLKLLMVNPSNRTAVAEISFASGYMITPTAITEYRMLKLLEKYYKISREWRYGVVRASAGGGAETVAPPLIASEPPPVLDLQAAGQILDQASDRDEIVKTTLSFFSNYFHRSVLFLVRRGFVVGLGGYGKGLEDVIIRAMVLPLEKPSVFKTVVDGKSHYIGTLARNDVNIYLLKALGGIIPENVFATPILLRDRVINVIYSDNGDRGKVETDIGDLLLFSRKIASAYDRLIHERLQQTD